MSVGATDAFGSMPAVAPCGNENRSGFLVALETTFGRRGGLGIADHSETKNQ